MPNAKVVRIGGMALFWELPALICANMESQKQGVNTSLTFHVMRWKAKGAEQQIPQTQIRAGFNESRNYTV